MFTLTGHVVFVFLFFLKGGGGGGGGLAVINQGSHWGEGLGRQVEGRAALRLHPRWGVTHPGVAGPGGGIGQVYRVLVAGWGSPKGGWGRKLRAGAVAKGGVGQPYQRTGLL